MYTNPVVCDQKPYISKAQFFDLDVYDSNHREHAKFVPGFVFGDVAGAELKVVGILDRDARVDDLVDEQKGLATSGTF